MISLNNMNWRHLKVDLSYISYVLVSERVKRTLPRKMFVYSEALVFPLLLYPSSLSARQLVAAGDEAPGDVEGALITASAVSTETTENKQDLFQ